MYMWRHAIKPTARVSLEFAWRLEGALTSSCWWWASEIIGSHYHVTENKPAAATNPNDSKSFPPPLFPTMYSALLPDKKGIVCYHTIYPLCLSFVDIIQLLMMKRAIGTLNGIYWTERGSTFYFFPSASGNPGTALLYKPEHKVDVEYIRIKNSGWDPPFLGLEWKHRREEGDFRHHHHHHSERARWTLNAGIYYILGQSQHENYTPLPVVEP